MIEKLSKPVWALGLMSGTSADGIDGALLYTDGIRIHEFGPSHFLPYPNTLRNKILQAYGRPPGPEVSSLEKALTEHHALVVKDMVARFEQKVDLIGFHGQTLFHRPPHSGKAGHTHQIGEGALLATLTEIPVVNQFRLNDMAHGGQGAPLVPLFHQALAKDLPKPVVILNLGGVSNVTWMGEKETDLIAFDTGPGNALIDDWVQQKAGLAWDEGGGIAARGQVHKEHIARWLAHSYFSKKAPKSLDRNTFNPFMKEIASLSLEDGAATLTAFTAASIGLASPYFPQHPVLWVVAGGGANNPTLLSMIEDTIEQPLVKADEKGWRGDVLEAQAFAYLAVRSLRGLPLTMPGTTGVPFALSGGKVHRSNQN